MTFKTQISVTVAMFGNSCVNSHVKMCNSVYLTQAVAVHFLK